MRLNLTHFFIHYDVLFLENICYRPFVLFAVLILACESRSEWLYFLNSGNSPERNYFNEERVEIKRKYYEKTVGIGQEFIGIIEPEIECTQISNETKLQSYRKKGTVTKHICKYLS